MIKKTNARHGDFYIFTNDIFISRCLDLYGEWSEAEMVVYETFIQIGCHGCRFGRRLTG